MSVPEYKLYFWCAFQLLTEEDSRHNRKPQLKPSHASRFAGRNDTVSSSSEVFLCLLQFCRSIFFLELVHTVPNNVFEVLQSFKDLIFMPLRHILHRAIIQKTRFIPCCRGSRLGRQVFNSLRRVVKILYILIVSRNSSTCMRALERGKGAFRRHRTS